MPSNPESCRAWRARNTEYVRAYNLSYRNSHKEENAARSRAYAIKNREKLRIWDANRRLRDGEKRKSDVRLWKKEHEHESRLHYRKKYQSLRERLLEFFGNKCTRCGFNDSRALQLDHINGDGAKERKSLGSGSSSSIYRKAIKNPDGYQLLCANCNWIKRAENQETRKKKEPSNAGTF